MNDLNFKVVKILNDVLEINWELPFKFDSNKVTNVEFENSSAPFYIVNPARNDEDAAKECITLDKNGDVTIEPCNLSNYQRWNANGRARTC